jgi:hypothetical protein
VIRGHWFEVCEEAEMTKADRTLLWGRQFFNPFALEDLEYHDAKLAKLAEEFQKHE